MNGQDCLRETLFSILFLEMDFSIFLFHQEMNGNSKKLYKNYNCNSFYQICVNFKNFFSPIYTTGFKFQIYTQYVSYTAVK